MKIMLVAALVMLPAVLLAQETRGTISGTVTDAQGSAVPKATITATEMTTGTKATAVTNDSGAYTIPFLAQGEYQVAADLAGFKQAVRKGVTVDAGGHPVVDLKLEVGNTSESVTSRPKSHDRIRQRLGRPDRHHRGSRGPALNGRTPMMLARPRHGGHLHLEPGPVRPFDNSAPTSISMAGAPTRNQ